MKKTKQLKADIEELYSVGASESKLREKKKNYIREYQGSLLGSLLACIEFDNITRPEVKSIIESKLHGAILKFKEDEKVKRHIVEAYLKTKYERVTSDYIAEEHGQKKLATLVTEGIKQNYFNRDAYRFRDPVEFLGEQKFVKRRENFSSIEFKYGGTIVEATSPARVSYIPDLLKKSGNVPEEYRLFDERE